MQIRFISWNIHGRSHMESLIRTVKGDLVALQEVTVRAYQELVTSQLFAWSVFSLELRPPQPNEGKGRRLGCAVFGQAPFRLQKSWLLDTAPLPERTLLVEVDILDELFTICSFHAPPGVNWKKLKPQSQVALAQWLSRQQIPTLVGMDANAPKTDRPDILQNEWWWKDEPQLLGAYPLHHLQDALRVWLSTHPSEAEQLFTLRPQGPLAISHKRGFTKTACRYDFIYTTPHFTVIHIDYLYDEAITAGSDHALVVADLAYEKEYGQR